MDRRFLSLFFPSVAIDRLQRENPARSYRPFAVTQEEKGHSYIVAVNLPASESGITPGARLTDARTVLPTLEIVPDDLGANSRILQRLVEWCDRYSPLVAHDGFGGIVLDITGCAHLFGGEDQLLNDLQSRIRRTGYRVRGAIADTLGAAWAVARYGKMSVVTSAETAAVLDPLPVHALRLPEEIAGELRRVGIATIAALRKLPRQSLATRYGAGILTRLDQAFGHAEEPIVPYRPLTPYCAALALAEPIGSTGAVEHALHELLKKVCTRLEKAQVGAKCLDFDCYRVDGTIATLRVQTSKPVRSIVHFMRLFAEKMDLLDAGFGIEKVMLAAGNIDTLNPMQFAFPQFEPALDPENSLDGLIDRLGMRLGFQQVCRFRIRESFLPEHAIEFSPVTQPVMPNGEWQPYRIRPVRLLSPPMSIQVSAMLPGDSPIQFQIGRQMHRIVRMNGPERLTPEWWRDESISWETRDYYRIEDEKGARYWIFREKSVHAPSHQARWFLHGHLP